MLAKVKRHKREHSPGKSEDQNNLFPQSKTPECQSYENSPQSLKTDRSRSKNLNQNAKYIFQNSKIKERPIKHPLSEPFHLSQFSSSPRDFFPISPIKNRKQLSNITYKKALKVPKDSVSLSNIPESFNQINLHVKHKKKNNEPIGQNHFPKKSLKNVSLIQIPFTKPNSINPLESPIIKPHPFILKHFSPKISNDRNKPLISLNKLDAIEHYKTPQKRMASLVFVPISIDEAKCFEFEETEQKEMENLITKAQVSLMKNQLKLDEVLVKLSKLSLIV